MACANYPCGANSRDWSLDWLNSSAAGFIRIAPVAAWESLYDDGAISVSVASAETLLAMKLRASRAGRDDDDIADLTALCKIDSIEAADAHFESFYPGEILEPKAYRILDGILSKGVPEPPQAPPVVDLETRDG